MIVTVTQANDVQEALGITAQVLKSIIPTVQQSAAHIQRIATDTQDLVSRAERIASSAHVNSALTEKLTNIIGQACASSEKLAALANQVNELARALDEVAARFKL